MPGGAAAAAPEEERRRGSRLWLIVFWVALAVCLASVGALAFIGWTYWSADRSYQDIAQRAFDAPAADEAFALGDMTVDWEYLRSVNPEVVAWVYVPGTRINYPIAQADDDAKYLDTSFDGQTGFAGRGGAIFLEAMNDGGFADDNNVIYGHNMRDGSMFAAISTELEDEGRFNELRTIYLLTPRMNFRFTTFALIETDGWDRLVQTAFPTDADRTAYLADKIGRSVVTPSEGMPDPAGIEKVLTLSTCDYNKDNGRAVLFSFEADRAIPNSAQKGGAVDPADAQAIQDAAKES